MTITTARSLLAPAAGLRSAIVRGDEWFSGS